MLARPPVPGTGKPDCEAVRGPNDGESSSDPLRVEPDYVANHRRCDWDSVASGSLEA